MLMKFGIWNKAVTKGIWSKIPGLDLVSLVSFLVCSLKLKLR